MTKVCGDLIRGVSQDLRPNTQWQIELLEISTGNLCSAFVLWPRR